MFIQAIVLTALAVGVSPAKGAEALTLERALALASERSQAARAARAATVGATDAAKAADQLPDPVVSLGIENMPVTGPDKFRTTADFMTMRRIAVAQEWIPAEKRELQLAVGHARAAREAAFVRTAVAEARLQSALAFVDAYYIREVLRLTRLNEHHAQEELELAKARLRSSAGSGQEVLALTASRGVAEDEFAAALQQEASAIVGLERWIGLQTAALSAPVWPLEVLQKDYVAAHPAVQHALSAVNIARTDASLAASNRTPNWTWQLSYGQRSGLPDLASFGVSIPLPVSPALRQDRETSAKLASVQKAEAELEEITRSVAAEYRTLVSDLQRLAQRIDRYRNTVVVLTQQRMEAALAGYRSNQGSLLALFEARHAHVESQRKLLALQQEHAKAMAQLVFKPVAGGSQ